MIIPFNSILNVFFFFIYIKHIFDRELIYGSDLLNFDFVHTKTLKKNSDIPEVLQKYEISLITAACWSQRLLQKVVICHILSLQKLITKLKLNKKKLWFPRYPTLKETKKIKVNNSYQVGCMLFHCRLIFRWTVSA